MGALDLCRLIGHISRLFLARKGILHRVGSPGPTPDIGPLGLQNPPAGMMEVGSQRLRSLLSTWFPACLSSSVLGLTHARRHVSRRTWNLQWVHPCPIGGQ